MRIITLTTDLGHRDPYLALAKTAIIGKVAGCHVVELSNDVRNNNVAAAAFMLRNSLPFFPEGTVHLVSIRSAAEKSAANRAGHADPSRYLATAFQGQWILTSDNGLFTLMDNAFSEPVYQIYYHSQSERKFYLHDVLVPVAAHLCEGKPLQEVGTPVTDYYRSFQFECYEEGNQLRGKGVYADDFGNIVTNISKEKFLQVAGKRTFSIVLPGARIQTISASYDDVRFGSPLAMFNSFGYLEIAVNGNSAFRMLCPRDIGGFDFNLIIEFND
jgi:S-adenosyl-L-methionine hydrolase (adenosine-forming)